jgi:hypothetical protein
VAALAHMQLAKDKCREALVQVVAVAVVIQQIQILHF